MNISSINTTTFGATKVGHTPILLWDDEIDDYELYPANFVKLDRNNKSDFDALSKLEYMWKGTDFISYITYAGKAMLDNNLSYRNVDIYALTTQKDNFEKLNENYITGVAQVIDEHNGKIHLGLLQARPLNTGFKRVGTGILNCLKDMSDVITLSAANNTDGFYEKNGFKKSRRFYGLYAWQRPLKERIKRKFDEYFHKKTD